MSGTTFDHLPYEVLVMIMKYLNPSDRRDASLVSKSFAEASGNASNITLHFDYCHLGDTCAPLSHFLNPFRQYKRVIFGSNADFRSSFEQFCQASPLIEVTVDHCKGIKIDFLIAALSTLKELKKLTLKCPRARFLSGDSIKTDAAPLSTVESLILDCSHMTVDQFEGLMQLFPNVKSFGLSFCNDPSLDEDPRNLLSCEYLMRFITERQFQEVFLEDFVTQILREEQLVTMKNLKKFSFSLMDAAGSMEFFAQNNKEITEMGTKDGMLISTSNLIHATKSLPQLKVLNVKVSGDSLNLNFLNDVKGLRQFSLTTETALSVDSHEFHHLAPNHRLQTFTLSYYNICHLCLKQLTECYPNLTALKLEYVEVFDSDLQMIFKNLSRLQRFHLTGCEYITDAGLIGWRQVKGQKMIKPEYSLSNLKDLKALNLSGCRNISNVSLFNAFVLPALRKLRLSELKQISDIGIEAVTQNCPQIEHLDLGGGKAVTDDCVQAIAQNLKKLRWLDVHNCPKLTAEAWNHLASSCRSLQCLFCWHCNFTAFTSDLLFTRIPSLKMIYYESKDRRCDKEIHE